MRQGIITKYLGPTGTKGSRVKATARKASAHGAEMALTLPKDYSLNYDADHCRVAKALAEKLGWHGVWVGGGTPDETGYQWNTLEGSFSRAWVERYLCGRENVDWFLVEER